MKYEMINEELRIASCSLADLTLEQVKHFLGQWEPGSNIGNLILFYEKEDDVIVLNSSNKKYQVWLDIVEAYLIATGEDKEKLQEMMFKYSEDAAKILDNCLNDTPGEIEIPVKMLVTCARTERPHGALLQFDTGIRHGM